MHLHRKAADHTLNMTKIFSAFDQMSAKVTEML